MVAQFFGPCAQKGLLAFDLGDVGVDSDPAAFGQGVPFDADHAAIGAGALHVVRGKGTGLFEACRHVVRDIVNLAIFAAFGQIADHILETRAGRGERVGQVEHLLHAAVRDHQT